MLGLKRQCSGRWFGLKCRQNLHWNRLRHISLVCPSSKQFEHRGRVEGCVVLGRYGGRIPLFTVWVPRGALEGRLPRFSPLPLDDCPLADGVRDVRAMLFETLCGCTRQEDGMQTLERFACIGIVLEGVMDTERGVSETVCGRGVVASCTSMGLYRFPADR